MHVFFQLKNESKVFLMLRLSLRLIDIKNCFLWCLLPTKKGVPKRVYGNGGIFLSWGSYEVCWNGHFYTTILNGNFT